MPLPSSSSASRSVSQREFEPAQVTGLIETQSDSSESLHHYVADECQSDDILDSFDSELQQIIEDARGLNGEDRQEQAISRIQQDNPSLLEQLPSQLEE